MHETQTRRALSPVIGVVLLIELSIILAASLAAFVLEIGDATTAEGPWDAEEPIASFEVERTGGWLTVTHTGGDAIDADSLTVSVDGDTLEWDGDGEVSEGDSMIVRPGEYVEVVWRAHGLESTLADERLSG